MAAAASAEDSRPGGDGPVRDRRGSRPPRAAHRRGGSAPGAASACRSAGRIRPASPPQARAPARPPPGRSPRGPGSPDRGGPATSREGPGARSRDLDDERLDSDGDESGVRRSGPGRWTPPCSLAPLEDPAARALRPGDAHRHLPRDETTVRSREPSSPGRSLQAALRDTAAPGPSTPRTRRHPRDGERPGRDDRRARVRRPSLPVPAAPDAAA